MQLDSKDEQNLSEIRELLTEAQLVPVGLENEDLHIFCRKDRSGRMIGVIAVEVFKDGCLLRSLAVSEKVRNQGIARALLNEALQFAKEIKSDHLYLLTETIGETMVRYGFRDISRDKVPSSITASPFFNGICPCSSRLMYKKLSDIQNTSKVEEAVNRFKDGYSCSQAVFMTYGKQFGIDEKMAKKIARSFGGGMGRTCQTCGAVTGAYMVLGLANQEDDEKTAKEKTYALVQEFSRRFQDEHGSVNCQQLLGCDLGTNEGQEFFRNNHLIHKCRAFVRDAASILEQLSKLNNSVG